MEPNHHVDKDISLSIYGCYGVVILVIEVQSVGRRRGRSANDATVSVTHTASVHYSMCVTVSVVNLLFSLLITINQTHTHMHVHMPCTHSCINARMHTHPSLHTHTVTDKHTHTHLQQDFTQCSTIETTVMTFSTQLAPDCTYTHHSRITLKFMTDVNHASTASTISASLKCWVAGTANACPIHYTTTQMGPGG